MAFISARSTRLKATGLSSPRRTAARGLIKAHHYIDRGLVAGVERNKVRLSATGTVAVTMEEEK
jgi:hypothetical protein